MRVYPSSILEVEEENYSEKSETSSRISSNTLTVRHIENTLHFKYDLSTISQFNERRDSEFTYNLDFQQRDAEDDSLLAFCPIEIHERKFLRNLQQQQEKQDSTFTGKQDTTKVSNSLQIPIISVPNVMEKPPMKENVYTSENMTIIDTDQPVSE